MSKIKTLLQGKGLSHPLHPALVHLPVAAWSLSLVADLSSFFMSYGEAAGTLARMSYWLILVGLIFAVPTAMTGLAEFVDVPPKTKARSVAWAHMSLNVFLIGAYVLQILWRVPGDVSENVLIVNGTCFVLLAISGYLGGRLVYHYRVGVRSYENPQRRTHPEDHRVLDQNH